jgi:hypothetical protein
MGATACFPTYLLSLFPIIVILMPLLLEAV